MSKPFVSFICPTFGRPPSHLRFLQEKVYWFTRQTYDGPMELVLGNDAPNQHLICSVPGVRVINFPERFATLGQKYNAIIEACRDGIILPDEDDDISLPHRAEQAVERLQDADYFNPQQSWLELGGKMQADHQHGICHNASAYHCSLWFRIGHYAEISGPQDADFDGRVKGSGRFRIAPPLAHSSEWSYVYRWGVSNLHLSGQINTDKAYREAKAESSIVIIEPFMHRDYAAMTR